MNWVIIEQDEGLIVEYQQSEDVTVFFVDYDECKRGSMEYAPQKLEELNKLDELGLIDPEEAMKVRQHLERYALESF